MKSPTSVRTLEDLGKVQLSPSYFMRDFLYSEISQIEKIPNIPDYPDVAIEVGRSLCTQLLEPIEKVLGRISIRSGYRSPLVNAKVQKMVINTVVLAMKRIMESISGTIEIKRVAWGLLLVLSLTRLYLITKRLEIGKLWHGGFMTMCQSIRKCTFSQSLQH